MTQVSQKHDVFSNAHDFFANFLTFIGSRNFRRNKDNCPALSAHLRHDIGEDDYRPAAALSFTQQQAARVRSVERMLLRSF